VETIVQQIGDPLMFACDYGSYNAIYNLLKLDRYDVNELRYIKQYVLGEAFIIKKTLLQMVSVDTTNYAYYDEYIKIAKLLIEYGAYTDNIDLFPSVIEHIKVVKNKLIVNLTDFFPKVLAILIGEFV
jgi:hypothetical protein